MRRIDLDDRRIQPCGYVACTPEQVAIMKLSDVMHRNVEVIPGDMTVRDAAQRMSNLDIGSLPVHANDRLFGLLTDRDVVVRSVARGDDPDKTRVSDVMTSKVQWCFEEAESGGVTRR